MGMSCVMICAKYLVYLFNALFAVSIIGWSNDFTRFSYVIFPLDYWPCIGSSGVYYPGPILPLFNFYRSNILVSTTGSNNSWWCCVFYRICRLLWSGKGKFMDDTHCKHQIVTFKNLITKL